MKKDKLLNFSEFLEYVSFKLKNVKNKFPELNLDESHLFISLMISYGDILKLEKSYGDFLSTIYKEIK